MKNLSKDFKGQRPILIQPAQAESFLERAASVQVPLGAKISDMNDMLEAVFGAKPTLEKFPPYAIVPVKGVIGKNVSTFESLCGCCDIEDIEEMLEDCERDASITCVILDIDSPGGTSVGVPELANRIKNYSKHTIAFTESECCSAAYWIGSQANEFYATPSSAIGSIGVYIAFPDLSEAYKMEGVRMDIIKSGLYKGAGIPGTSLDANQRKMLEDEVKDIHADFKAAVKSVREFVEDASMEGQCFSGKRGAEAGLVTTLVNGFDELMVSLDAAVASQMEADEANDERAEEGEEGSDEGDEGEEKSEDEGDEDDKEKKMGVMLSASDRALSGICKSSLKAGKVSEDDDEDDKKEDDEDEKPESEDDEDGDEKKEDDEEDGVKPQPKSSDDEDEDDKKSEDEGEDDQDDGKEDADDEADSGDKAVDTDGKHNRNGTKRNKGKRLA